MAQRQQQRFVAINTTRRTRLFNIFEHEMDTLSTWNTISTAMVGIGSFFLSAAFTLWTEDSLSPAGTDEGKVLVSVGIPVSLLAALVCYILAGVFLHKRGGTLRRIKSESDDGSSHQ